MSYKAMKAFDSKSNRFNRGDTIYSGFTSNTGANRDEVFSKVSKNECLSLLIDQKGNNSHNNLISFVPTRQNQK